MDITGRLAGKVALVTGGSRGIGAAAEFAGRGITVNAVAPGSTATGPFASLTEEQKVAAGSMGRSGGRPDRGGTVRGGRDRAAAKPKPPPGRSTSY